MKPLEIDAVCEATHHHARIELTTQSPWCALLGDLPLPAEGSLDRLEAALSGARIERVRLIGHPVSCLLPMIWIRNIWGSPSSPHIEVEWEGDELHNLDCPTLIPATRLACLLADDVCCTNTEDVAERYGFDPRSPGVREDAFDLLTNLVDVWDPGLRSAVLGEDWTGSVRATLAQCAIDGHHRIGIYGAGTHTRAVGEAFMEPPIEICCIIDDDARRYGQHLWGFEITSPERALEMDLDAVVISANSIEDVLWERASVFRERGIATICVYADSAEVIDAHQ
ncbi:MAG: hypothetical protein ACX94C_04555 [Phycisphaerales bacterium]